jgi:uncharacterized delta-60 repeat protein
MKSSNIDRAGRALPESRYGWLRRIIVAALLLAIVQALPAAAAVGGWDAGFGDQGHVEVEGNAGPNVLELAGGQIFVVGTVTVTNGTAANDRLVALDRYLPNGEPDMSFGVDGRVIVQLPIPIAGISAIALQHDGKVVMAGTSWSKEGAYSFVARIGATGALDPAFGSGGVTAIAGTEPSYGSVAVLPTGVIVAPISDWTSDRVDRFATDGQRLEDRMRGFVAPARLALQHDGRIIVSGWNRNLKQSGVVRLQLDGSIDMTFGTEGFAPVDDGYQYNVAVEPGTDRVVLCGPGFVRLTADGHPDPSFGVQGTGYVAFGASTVPPLQYCRRLLPMWDGTLAYIGQGAADPATGIAPAFVAGLTSDGNADLRFGAGTGRLEITSGGIGPNPAPYVDYSNAFVRTRDGDALLTWSTAKGLQLARIDLDAGTGNDLPLPPIATPTEPPASPVPTTPASTTSEPKPTAAVAGKSGGGGSTDWLDIALLLFAALLLQLRSLNRNPKRGRCDRSQCRASHR